MSANPIPSTGVLFRVIWNDTIQVLARMPGLSLICFAIVFCSGFIEPLIDADNALLRETVSASSEILIVPFNVAIYRLLILNEATFRYDFAIFTQRFRRLLAWTVGFWLLVNATPYLVGYMTSSDAGRVVVFPAACLIELVAVLRLGLLFPAIAIDAEGASVKNALADSRGRVWFILKAFLIWFLPLLLLIFAMAGLTFLRLGADTSGLSFWSSLPETVFVSLVSLLTTVVAAVTLSRLFLWLGNRLNGSASPIGWPRPCLCNSRQRP